MAYLFRCVTANRAFPARRRLLKSLARDGELRGRKPVTWLAARDEAEGSKALWRFCP